MFGLLKWYRHPKTFFEIKQIVRRSSHNIPRNGVVRLYGQPIFKKQILCDNLKVRNFLRGSTVAIRQSSSFSNRSKKIVEFIFTRRGVVLIGVILSIVTGYYVVLLSICIVLDEIIKKTVR